MRVSDATKLLNKLKWNPSEPFRKRPLDEQEKIRKATLVLARAGKTYQPPESKADSKGSE
jgi:hypothetical protein